MATREAVVRLRPGDVGFTVRVRFSRGLAVQFWLTRILLMAAAAVGVIEEMVIEDADGEVF